MKWTARCLRFAVVVTVAAGGIYLLNSPAKAEGAGEKIYKEKCASCHGHDGKGETPAGKATKARDFCSDEVQKETDEEWTAAVVKGKNRMPSYEKKLTEAEVKEVVAYIHSLCKK
ncbi:MAG TPA: c-type cytochrome [Candidatus Solibacter sp.]|nr:c-type cytochrome [Candidatus Solibacter sp.]